jgi:hypothetical protein
MKSIRRLCRVLVPEPWGLVVAEILPDSLAYQTYKHAQGQLVNPSLSPSFLRPLRIVPPSRQRRRKDSR